MTTRAEIIAEARSWKGTKWAHQGRLKGVAADCAGMVLKTGEALGLVSQEDAEKTDYGREPEPMKMKAALDKLFIRIPITDLQPGDIPWMRAGERAQHIGILTERNTLIHAINYKTVEELPIEQGMKNRFVAAYRYKGVED